MKAENKLSKSSEKWIEDVSSGKRQMTQRKYSTIIKNDGTIKPIVDFAKSKNVHLLKLTDDKGNLLIIASNEIFKTLC